MAATIRLVGTFGNEVNEAARVVHCRVSVTATRVPTVVSANVRLGTELATRLTEIVELAEQDLREIGILTPDARLAVTLRVTSQHEVGGLEDTSYTLPLYAAIMTQMLQLPVDARFAGTGSLRRDGQIEAVGRVRSKSQAAARDGASYFVYPAGGQEHAEDHRIRPTPIRDRLAAVAAWSGLEAFAAVVGSESSDACMLAWLVGVLDIGRQHNLLADRGRWFRSLGERSPRLALANPDVRLQWLKICLNVVPQLDERCYDDLVQLLDPGKPIAEYILDPDGVTVLQTVIDLEPIFVDTLTRLTSAMTNGFERDDVRAAEATLRLATYYLPSRIHSLMRDEHAPLTQAVVRLAKVGQAVLSHVDAPARDAWASLRRYIATLVRLRGQSLEPVGTEIDLLIIPQYDTRGLEALDFALLDQQRQWRGWRIMAPAALYDRSASLPPAWRRSDSTMPGQSELDNLEMAARQQTGCSILEAFGRRNCFLFERVIPHADRTLIYWQDASGVWPVAIDSLHLVSDMRDAGFYTQPLPRVLDLGCGTGVHGILMRRHNRSVRVSHFRDIEPGSRLQVRTNILRNFFREGPLPNGVRVEKFLMSDEEYDLGDAGFFRFSGAARTDGSLEPDEPYDLIICTPPYAPFVEDLQGAGLGLWRAVSGTSLIKDILRTWHHTSRRLVIQFSDFALADPEVRDLIEAARPTVIGDHVVGFRFPGVDRLFRPDASNEMRAGGERWWRRIADRLIDTESHATTQELPPHHGFRYFHRVRSYLVGEGFGSDAGRALSADDL